MKYSLSVYRYEEFYILEISDSDGRNVLFAFPTEKQALQAYSMLCGLLDAFRTILAQSSAMKTPRDIGVELPN